MQTLTTLYQRPTYSLTLRDNRSLRYVAFFYLYVMQGIPAGFALYALANYLTANGLTPAAVGSFAAVVGFPWSIQFVWGPLIDKHQESAMGRRRPWVLLAQSMAFLASLGLLLVHDPVSELSLLSGAFFIHSIFASVQDASVDALAISVIPESERGRITAVMRGGFLGGIALGSALLSVLIRSQGFFTAALTQSMLLLTLTLVTFFIKEERGDALFSFEKRQNGKSAYLAEASVSHQNVSLRWLFQELFRGLTSRKSLLLFLPMLVYYSSQAIFNRAYSVHLIQRLGWADTDVSVLQGTFGTVVIIAVLMLGGYLADRVGAAKLLLFMMAFNSVSFLVFNSLSAYWTDPAVAKAGLIAWSMMDPGFSVASMPVLMALCRKQVEGSQFTTYMALVNLADILGAYVSGQAQMHLSAPTIGLICGGLVLTALLVSSRVILGKNNRL